MSLHTTADMWSNNTNSTISENGESSLKDMIQQKSPLPRGLLESKASQQQRRPFQTLNSNTTPRTDATRAFGKLSKDAKMFKAQHYTPELMISSQGELDDESSTMSAQGKLEEKNQVQRYTNEIDMGIFRERIDANELMDDLWLIKRANPVFDSDDDDDAFRG